MTTHPSRRSFLLLLAAGAALTAAAAARGPAAAQGPGPGAAGQGGHDMPAMAPMQAMQAMPGMSGAAAPAPAMPEMNGAPGTAPTEGTAAADDVMAHEHMGMGPHMKMTAPRPRTAADERRAEAVVETLRGAIAKYRDYRVAVADHFVQYLPNIKLPMYHFTNYEYAAQAHSHFDPSRPTSLLYKPVAGGFELIGAMYTAPRGFDEDQLDERVPLSITAWHQHVNLCLPPPTKYPTSDWSRFGFHGTIATATECQASGGVFHPVVFGWMVHVYPFETDAAKIWAH
jgi:hypothetical protein